MNWQYQGKDIVELPNDCVGFVYQITNTTNGRMYIGKKLAKFKRSRPPLKGRRNKRRYKVNSDWEDYYGSSDDLTIDIKKLGKENFKREILFYCKSKAEMSYVEECLSKREGPVIAASDYIRSFADQIRPYTSKAFYSFGTDGYGRSDTRKNLRKFFEIDKEHLVVYGLSILAKEQLITSKYSKDAMKKYNIDGDKPMPIKL